MGDIIFHVGMGKTGSTTLQHALTSNSGILSAHRHRYLGPWMGALGAEFDGFAGFQKFLRQSPEDLRRSAEALLNSVEGAALADGVDVFVVSNEQYLENVAALKGFFDTLSLGANVKIFISVRPPADWLPSAYIQWGVAHKTNPGAVRSFAEKARELVKQYEHIKTWRDCFGTAVTVVPLVSGADLVSTFSDFLGVRLIPGGGRQQVRPAVSEILLRAACNNSVPGLVLPDVYNGIVSAVPAGMPRSLSGKMSHVLNFDAVDEILEENRATFDYLSREFGLTVQDPARSGREEPDLASVSEDILGGLMDLVFKQAHQIEDLTSRLEAIERQHEKP